MSRVLSPVSLVLVLLPPLRVSPCPAFTLFSRSLVLATRSAQLSTVGGERTVFLLFSSLLICSLLLPVPTHGTSDWASSRSTDEDNERGARGQLSLLCAGSSTVYRLPSTGSSLSFFFSSFLPLSPRSSPPKQPAVSCQFIPLVPSDANSFHQICNGLERSKVRREWAELHSTLCLETPYAVHLGHLVRCTLYTVHCTLHILRHTSYTVQDKTNVNKQLTRRVANEDLTCLFSKSCSLLPLFLSLPLFLFLYFSSLFAIAWLMRDRFGHSYCLSLSLSLYRLVWVSVLSSCLSLRVYMCLSHDVMERDMRQWVMSSERERESEQFRWCNKNKDESRNNQRMKEKSWQDLSSSCLVLMTWNPWMEWKWVTVQSVSHSICSLLWLTSLSSVQVTCLSPSPTHFTYKYKSKTYKNTRANNLCHASYSITVFLFITSVT